MRKYFIAVFTVAFSLLLGNIISAADLQEGFMGYKWGDKAWRYDGLTELRNTGDVSYYSNPDESYIIDDIAVGDVVFGFYQGSLFAVYIGVDTLEQYDNITRYLKTKYGLPDTKSSARENLITFKWKYQDISIKLKTDKISGKMKLAFYYGPLARELKQDRLEQVSDTSFRFFPIDKNSRPEMIPFFTF